MNRYEKKVVLLIVEGDSEEGLLIDRLRKLFSQHRIRFIVVGGDILYNMFESNKSIKAAIGDTVKAFIQKNKFKRDDIHAVLHIIDTDGCLIPEENVIINESQDQLTKYNQDDISVSNEKQRGHIVLRNKHRSNNIHIMSTASIILSEISYRMYYFSRNLEHVLFDEANPEQETKVQDVEDFITNLEIPIEEFLAEHMINSIENDHDSCYSESWRLISQQTASLKRYTNVPLLFEYIKVKIDSD